MVVVRVDGLLGADWVEMAVGKGEGVNFGD